MKKFVRKVVKTFKRFTDAKLLAFGQAVTEAMGKAVTTFPNPVPALADINAELATYNSLMLLAASKDKVQVALKNQSKQQVKNLLSQLADYVNLTATTRAQQEESGFELNKIPEPIKMKAPARVTLEDGNNSGELTMKFKKVKGASSYLFQYTSDAMLGDGSWQTLPATTSTFTFTGLAKGTTYYCRAVAVGSNGQVMNSIVVNRVSQ